MEFYDQHAPRVNRLATYASLLADQDTGNQSNAALRARAQSLASRFSAAVSFAEPELLAISPMIIGLWLETDKRCQTYQQYFDNLNRRRAHVRSAEVEEALAQSRDALSQPANAYIALTNADLKFMEATRSDGSHVPVALGNINALLDSDDRALRQSAFESYNDGFLSVKNTSAAILAGKVKATAFQAHARRYHDSLEMSLHDYNVTRAVYENVIDACNRHLPIWHRYWEARRKLLRLDVSRPWDIFAPIGAPFTVSYEQAVEWICEGLAPLGADYVASVRAGCTSERWVDSTTNIGKRQGAYSNGTFGCKPFILMSYNPESGLGGMSTLAHELGHAMHSTWSNEKQPFVYARYSLFAAEVASNMNQALVRAHLLKKSDERNWQLAVIDEAMSNFHRYLFLMPILSQFELYAHQQVEGGKALTADAMSSYAADLFANGYGAAIDMRDSQTRMRQGIAWSQFNHLYANFYVYQYASGIAAANALADGILQDGTGAARDRYRTFLSAGGSQYPLDALKAAGIDMTSPAPMDRAFGVLEGFVARLEALI
jgi:oligoendopeptidase F